MKVTLKSQTYQNSFLCQFRSVPNLNELYYNRLFFLWTNHKWIAVFVSEFKLNSLLFQIKQLITCACKISATLLISELKRVISSNDLKFKTRNIKLESQDYTKKGQDFLHNSETLCIYQGNSAFISVAYNLSLKYSVCTIKVLWNKSSVKYPHEFVYILHSFDVNFKRHYLCKTATSRL